MVFVTEHPDSIPKGTPAESSEQAESPVLYCPVCYRDLKAMTVTGRTQHVNNCLGKNVPSVCLLLSYDLVFPKALASRRTGSHHQSPPALHRAAVRVLPLALPPHSQMSVSQLSSLIQRMEDAKAKLEVFLLLLFSVDAAAASPRDLLPQAIRRDSQQSASSRPAGPRRPFLRDGAGLHADRVQSAAADRFLLAAGASHRR